MLIPVLLFIVGLLCLIKGGDWFVDGATGIARRFKVPELLIGATVVSIGTTLPEVMVSTTSAMTGHGEIAYGNAIGSVICNAALIAAITIAVRPGKVDPKSLRVKGIVTAKTDAAPNTVSCVEMSQSAFKKASRGTANISISVHSTPIDTNLLS